MMLVVARRGARSISGPIIWGASSVALTTALLVGWIYVILENRAMALTANTWLLVAGILSFSALITVLVLFAVFLVRETLEVRRRITFVDSVTHELRSPLASLRLCLETLERSEISTGQRESLRQMMLDDVDRLSGFIDDILEATRLEHGDRVHSVARVQLGDLVQRCATAVARRHKIDPEAITIEIPRDFEIATDSTALEIVFRNLLDNAIKYSEGAPVVIVTAVRDQDRAFIDVVDRGIGIPRHALSRVFDRFYRVDAEAVRARRGTGLGLFVVRALVRSLGGKLRAHSEGPGSGTKMSVTLPLRSATAEPSAAPQRAPA